MEFTIASGVKIVVDGECDQCKGSAQLIALQTKHISVLRHVEYRIRTWELKPINNLWDKGIQPGGVRYQTHRRGFDNIDFSAIIQLFLRERGIACLNNT